VQWTDLYRRMKIQDTVYELLKPAVRNWREIQEAKEIPTVNAIDPASLPEKKSWPPRALVAVGLSLLSLSQPRPWIVGRRTLEESRSEDPGKRLMAEIFRRDVQPNARARAVAPRSAGVRCLASRHSAVPLIMNLASSGPLEQAAPGARARLKVFALGIPQDPPVVLGAGSPAFRSWIRGFFSGSSFLLNVFPRALAQQGSLWRVRGLLRGHAVSPRIPQRALDRTHDGHRSLLLSGSADRLFRRATPNTLLARRASVPASRWPLAAFLMLGPARSVLTPAVASSQSVFL